MSVSAVMPVYNGADFVADAIESIYSQTVPPAEVIVVDDGSTDGTPAILRRFEGRPGFRSIRKPQGGEASARNAGVELATEEYVAFLDHDDLWRPLKLERQLAEFDPGWGMSFTAHEHAATTGSEVWRHEAWDPDPEAVTDLLVESCAVRPVSTVVVRRDALKRVGAFEQVSPFGDDWLMWLRFAAAGNPIGYLPEPLTEYRWHGNNMSSNEQGEYFDAACVVFDRYGDRQLRARWRLAAAVYAHNHQDPKRARKRILEAAWVRPWAVRPGWMRLLL
jgi:glycosyltransferase involved in cell wall biosynthesis